MEKLVDCKKCGSNACFEQQIEETTTWLCFGCGFTTSTLQTKDSKIVKEAIKTSPELYKDLVFIDDNELAWLPSTVTIPNKGMVFIDGTSKQNWEWVSIKAVPILEEERDRFPKDQTHKMDMNSIQRYGQRGYMDSLDAIDFYDLG